MTTLIIIRHAESECNTKQINCTMGADPSLTLNGIIQAHQAGVILSSIYGSNFNFMAISNLTRTNHTAQIINHYLNINEIQYDNNLRERGTLYFGIKYFNKAGINKEIDYEGFLAGDEDYQTAFIPRVAKTLCKYLLGQEPLGLLVSHGKFSEAAVSYFFNKELLLKNAEFLTIDPLEIPDFITKCGLIQDYNYEL